MKKSNRVFINRSGSLVFLEFGFFETNMQFINGVHCLDSYDKKSTFDITNVSIELGFLNINEIINFTTLKNTKK